MVAELVAFPKLSRGVSSLSVHPCGQLFQCVAPGSLRRSFSASPRCDIDIIPTLPGDSRLLGRTENYKSAVPGTSKTHPSGPDHFSSYLEPHRTWFCFRFVALQAGLEFVTSVDGVGIDFALSLLTLQHMIPQLQIAVIEHLCDALAPSGLGFIQLLTGLDTSALVTSASKPS